MKTWIPILAIPVALLAQQPQQIRHMPADANPRFDIATIKPSQPDAAGGGSGVSPSGRFTAHNISLRGLILFAWNLHPRQLDGGPPWIDSDRFDISAQPDIEGFPSKGQLISMLQKLLADRFQLRLHREKKELAAYAITLAKQGPKLTASSGDCPQRHRALGRIRARNMNMEELAAGLQGSLDRPVIDRTGLIGRYDFALNWAPDEFQFPDRPANAPPPAVDPSLPDLFKAMEDQLGLKLESAKGQFDVMVLDHVEKPSSN